ncbi:DUF1990 family protein [Streptomyces celluloflavus]|uniref:DUF1990 family protein n=1 Tax=Streptomyces celluloflavus TaxID=58344 RepID=A0ABW7R7K2_9ACTN
MNRGGRAARRGRHRPPRGPPPQPPRPLRLRAPCRVVWSVAEEDRVGFAYGTRDGHPERGEEAFTVTLRADGSVWFTVTAFSRPDRFWTRLAGPLVPVLQRAYARHCGRTLRRLANRPRPGGR